METWIATEISTRLALALNEVVPDEVALAVTPYGAIKIFAGEYSGWTEVTPEPPLELFALRVLETLQDEVIECVAKTGWPPTDPSRPDAPQRAAELPAPHAEVIGEKLVCWFGARHDPALRVPSVRLHVDSSSTEIPNAG